LDAFPILRTEPAAQSPYVRVDGRGIDQVGGGPAQPIPRNYLSRVLSQHIENGRTNGPKRDAEIQKRLESPEYLSLIKKSFRDWSAAESEQKRVFIRNLLTTAAAYRICSDDVVRLFIQWIDTYSEAHFAAMKFIYKNPGSTRWEMWHGIYGSRVRDDSAEADLFKLIVHDLSTGHVIRQHRETNYAGQFLKAPRKRPVRSTTLTSPFDDDKPYELTELAAQFVRYTIEGVMPRISAAPQTDSQPNGTNH
jgi:hypothetical protein